MADQSTQLFPNVWGIFDANGNAVMAVDTTLSVAYSNESRVSQFPVEEGGFVSYNKVATPYKARVRMAVGGDRQRIADFLNKLEVVLDDTANLYHVVTPEVTYLNATLEKYDYRRDHAKGQNMAVADLSLLEVRQVIPQYTNVSLPPSKVKKVTMAMMSSHGKQQPQTTPAPNYATMSFGQLKALAQQNAVQ